MTSDEELFNEWTRGFVVGVFCTGALLIVLGFIVFTIGALS